MKKRWPTYNDGVIDLYIAKDLESSFGAKKNIETVSDMDFIDRVCYSLSSMRSEDVEFADALGKKLTMKVKTRRNPGINDKEEYKAVSAGYLYNVFHVSMSASEMWLYLQGVKEIGE